MGDYFQTLVAPEITTARAQAEGQRMLDWLIGQGIISPHEKDCVLSAPLGHPPGPNYVRATGKSDPHLPSLWTNGLAVISKRTVFHSGWSELICSACNARFEPPDRWGDAVKEWFGRSGAGLLACPACGAARPVIDWQHDPPWAFGDLGFEFWNWPPFTQEFMSEFERQLGSRVVYVYGKL